MKFNSGVTLCEHCSRMFQIVQKCSHFVAQRYGESESYLESEIDQEKEIEKESKSESESESKRRAVEKEECTKVY